MLVCFWWRSPIFGMVVLKGRRAWERLHPGGRAGLLGRMLVWEEGTCVSCMDGRGVWVRQPVWERELHMSSRSRLFAYMAHARGWTNHVLRSLRGMA